MGFGNFEALVVDSKLEEVDGADPQIVLEIECLLLEFEGSWE